MSLCPLPRRLNFSSGKSGVKKVERNSVSDELRCAAIDELDAHEREVLVTSLRWFDLTSHCVTGLERILLDLVL
jgi:hypothetical protein